MRFKMGLFGSRAKIQDGLAFTPQFFKVLVDGQPGAFPPLDIAWTKELDPLATSSEQQLMRILGVGQLMAARGRDGGPPAPNRTGTPFTIATGYFDVLITSRRVVVLVQGGETALGPVDILEGSMLVASTPLRNVDKLTVEKRVLNLWDTAHGSLTLLREIIGVDRGSGLRDSRIGIRDVAADLTTALAAVRQT